MKLLPQKHRKLRITLCVIVLIIPLFYFYILPFIYYSSYSPKEGDIIFQALPNASDLVRAIEGITESCYSHCGVVIRSNDEWLVNEALGAVHSTPLFDWIKRGRGNYFSVFRLNTEYQGNIPNFLESLKKYQGKPYDAKYELDDWKIYCSELVYKAYYDATFEELGVLVELGSLNWKPYEKTIRKYEDGPPPLNRRMITPINLSKALQLTKIYSVGM
jgi:hypothetical protein